MLSLTHWLKQAPHHSHTSHTSAQTQRLQMLAILYTAVYVYICYTYTIHGVHVLYLHHTWCTCAILTPYMVYMCYTYTIHGVHVLYLHHTWCTCAILTPYMVYMCYTYTIHGVHVLYLHHTWCTCAILTPYMAIYVLYLWYTCAGVCLIVLQCLLMIGHRLWLCLTATTVPLLVLIVDIAPSIPSCSCVHDSLQLIEWNEPVRHIPIDTHAGSCLSQYDFGKPITQFCDPA